MIEQVLALSEFRDIDLGDERLERRAERIVNRIQEAPDVSFPKMFPIQAEAEAFYRFVESPYVKADSLMAPHIKATLERAVCADTVLVVHDSSEFVFAGERKGLHTSESSASFWGHCSMAVNAADGHPLGVLRMHTWVRAKITQRQAKKAGLSLEEIGQIPCESARWLEGVVKTESLFAEGSKVIHVCDSEADSYDIMSGLFENSYGFVIRGCHDRTIGEILYKHLRSKLENSPLIACRSVKLSRRLKATSSTAKRNVPREERVAKLGISSAQVTIKKPKTATTAKLETLALNVVYVREIEVPEGCDPVEWILLTSEPIGSADEILRVVDIYRHRWVIEEYFKALKTGCAYETRQLESYETLRKCLCLFVPVAWLMFHMRTISRRDETLPIEAVLPSPFTEVLSGYTGKKLKTAKDAVLAIAGLGGHIKHNGQPGWLIIWRGFRELASMVRGYMLAMKVSRLSRKRCDQ